MSLSEPRAVTMAVLRERWSAERLNGTSESMTDFAMPSGENWYQGIYVVEGSVSCSGKNFTQAQGFYLPAHTPMGPVDDTELELLRFVFAAGEINFTSNDYHELVLTQKFNTPLDQAVLRLDQVDFPPGAIAYRHTHPGGGLRYLTKGSLVLHSDHNKHALTTSEAWFEDADSAVTAVSDDKAPSRFVRMLLLPVSYKHKSSFTLADKSDASKPRLQTNSRFFDQPISL